MNERYQIDERVGCIAVVDTEIFRENCLAPDFDGVVAYWAGLRGKNGWEVQSWQKEKAQKLCDLLNHWRGQEG
jgi:hypothetical protein